MAKIIFIVQQLSQPRCIKRIDTIQRAGIPIKVYGFDNGLYSDNLKNLPFAIHEVIKRDKSESRFEKILLFYSTIRRIIRENDNDSLFYFFGFEIGSIARFCGAKRYIYEEADVTAARIQNKFIRWLLTTIDKRNVKKSEFTIFTSEGFIDYLYGNNQPKQVFVIPNRMNKVFLEEKRPLQKKTDVSHLVFGFVGLIRYPNTILNFAKIVGEKFPQHEFHFWGACDIVKYKSMLELLITDFKNIYYHGEFRSPIDLKDIYEKIDLNVVCYDVNSGNVGIAEPNKLYESIFFNTPIIVSDNTFLSKKVRKMSVGYAINALESQNIVDFIQNLTIESISLCQENMSAINTYELVDCEDELINRLNNIQKNSYGTTYSKT